MPPATSEMQPDQLQQPLQAPSKKALTAQWSLRLLLALFLLGSLFYFSAGSVYYWQAAVYLAAVFIPLAAISAIFLARNPAIIQRRLQIQEISRTQRALIRAFRPLFLFMLLIPGFDYRLSLSRSITGPVPLGLTITGDVLVILGLVFAGWVLRINEFAGRSIQVEPRQPLVSSGPYVVVRHPLYSASLLIWLATPLALGSWIALPLFALLVPFYVLRLMNEELVLIRDLPGYKAYCKRTPFRLVPFVW